MLRSVLGILLFIGLLLAGVACSAFNDTGSGRVASESRPVGGFNEVQVNGVGTLVIKQGEAEALTIEAEDNVLPHIRSAVRGGRLTVGLDSGQARSVNPTKPIRYYLTARNLNVIEVNGATAVEAAGFSTERLKVMLSGAGSAKFERLTTDELGATIAGAGSFSGSGTVKHQNVQITGAGQYLAEGLQSANATVTVSGTGRAIVRVDETLKVGISGAGGVDYIGNPQVQSEVSGLGKVSRRLDK